MEAIMVKEWNNLSNEEQNERCKTFGLTLRAGYPAGLSDLRHLALECGTPIPSIDEHYNIDFDGFDI